MEYILNGKEVKRDDIDKIINANRVEIFQIFYLISKLKEQCKKDDVKLCSIINAKSGKCPENCAFCAQSSHHKTDIKIFDLLSPQDILQRAKIAERAGAERFSIVTSGTSIKKRDNKDSIIETVKLIKSSTTLKICASLGICDRDFLNELKDAGLTGYHHNLETSASFFNNICTTHNYKEDIETVKSAKEIGFYTCSGGIFGLGESWDDRVEMANTLKELDVDSIAINFLNPIKGTKLENAHFLDPFECLKIVSLFRFINIDKDIRICGGRELNLRDFQGLLFAAGANGLMIGDYLTTKGRKSEDDIQMLSDLGFNI